MQAAEIIQRHCKRFILSCSTWEISLEKEINFDSSDWEKDLLTLVQKKARPPVSIGMDLFLFCRGTYKNIPLFALGRTGWDNWLIFKARAKRIPLIDASRFILSVHPDHEDSTHSGAYKVNAECLLNQRLTGWWPRTFIGQDATYILGKDGRLYKKGIFSLLKPRIKAITFLVRQVIGHLLQKVKKYVYTTA